RDYDHQQRRQRKGVVELEPRDQAVAPMRFIGRAGCSRNQHIDDRELCAEVRRPGKNMNPDKDVGARHRWLSSTLADEPIERATRPDRNRARWSARPSQTIARSP